MDDDPLTSQAIAELMCEIEKQTSTSKLQERKVNPLGGKPNKNFLGRTIYSALNYNKRETERTHANCQQKLQEMDERYERRKYNSFYNRNRSRSRSKSPSRSRRRRQSSRSISTSSRSRSRSRSRKRSKKKHKKKHKKHNKKPKKFKHRRRSSSRSSSSSNERKETSPLSKDQLTTTMLPQSGMLLHHTNNMALAVAMAYGQSLYAQSSKDLSKEQDPDALSMSDIVKELMSDEDDEDISKKQTEALSLSSSSDNDQQVLTINVESEEEKYESSRESDSSSGTCINLDDSTDDGEDQINDTSDLEIIESLPKQQALPLVVEKESEIETAAVDLTED